jgi:hypothetical protein
MPYTTWYYQLVAPSWKILDAAKYCLGSWELPYIMAAPKCIYISVTGSLGSFFKKNFLFLVLVCSIHIVYIYSWQLYTNI